MAKILLDKLNRMRESKRMKAELDAEDQLVLLRRFNFLHRDKRGDAGHKEEKEQQGEKKPQVN